MAKDSSHPSLPSESLISIQSPRRSVILTFKPYLIYNIAIPLKDGPLLTSISPTITTASTFLKNTFEINTKEKRIQITTNPYDSV